MENEYYININNQSYKYIEQWIQYITVHKMKNKNETYKSNLLITGPCGIGKTTYLHYLLKKHNFKIFEFNLIDFKATDKIKDQIKNILHFKDISLLFNNQSEHKVIIINQIDQFNVTERNILQYITDYIIDYNHTEKKEKKKNKKNQKNQKNQKNKIRKRKKRKKNYIPIVFMSNKYKTFFKSFRKFSMYLAFPLLSEYEISSFSKYYIHTHNILISEINLIRIQKYFPPNFKAISNILDLIKIYLHIHKKFNLIPIQQIIVHNKNDLDIDIYQSTYKLLSEPLSINECGYIMSKDTKYISLLLYKNMLYYLQHNTKNTFDNKLNQLCEFNQYIHLFSRITQYYLNDHTNLFLYNYVNYTLSKYSNLILHNKKHSLEYVSYTTVEKSPIISKLNYKFCNIKYIRSICNTIHINEYNFQLFSHYLYYLFSKYSTKKYKKLLLDVLHHYSFTYKEIDKIFKLSYIQKSKSKLINYTKIYNELIES
tara:strand:+ start:1222 stop:2670 length:1449 start_codon:yes stop_codon:yes gene_type:complete